MTESEHKIIEWSIYPLSEDWKKSVLFFLITGGILIAIHYSFYERWLTLLSALFLLGSLRMYWTPTYFRMNENGVEVRTPFYKVVHKWERFTTVKDDPRGLILTPFRSDSRLEAYRALFLRLPPNSNELKEKLTQYSLSQLHNPK